MPAPSPKLYECLVKSLAFACPYGEEAKDCPMSAYRKLPLQLRIEKVTQMECDCQKQIYLYHRHCLASREGKPVEMTSIGIRKTTTLLRSKKN